MRLLFYDKPVIYVIIHIGLGVIAAFYTPVLWIFLIYQTSQLILNRRFFLFEWEIKKGNSVEHTLIKVIEFFVGFLVGKLMSKLDNPIHRKEVNN